MGQPGPPGLLSAFCFWFLLLLICPHRSRDIKDITRGAGCAGFFSPRLFGGFIRGTHFPLCSVAWVTTGHPSFAGGSAAHHCVRGFYM